MKKFILNFLIISAVALVAGAATTYLWNVFRHGQTAVEWNTVVALAVVLGLVLSLTESRRA